MNSTEGGRSGLVNLGNTCFMNTCIQCMFHLPGFNEFITNTRFTEKEQRLLFNTKKLLKGLWENDCTVSPVTFHKLIKELAKKESNDNFSQNNQNDLQEFIIFLLDKYEQESSEYFKQNFTGKMKTKLFNNETDKQISSSEYEYTILPVPVIENGTLDECIEEYLSPEILEDDNQYFDEKSGEYIDVRRELDIESVPDNLIISLNRFRNDGRKITGIVDIPMELIIHAKVYSLVGIGNHTGDRFGGHYYAFALHGNNWYTFNDSGVQSIDTENIVKNTAYVLFYSLKTSE